MAVTDLLPGVVIAVTVGGNDLQEHRDDDLEEETRTTTRYIEATSGQNFAVRIKVKQGFRFAGDALSFHVHVDGHWMHAPLISAASCTFLPNSRSSEGRLEANGELRRYQFSTLETLSDGPVSQQEACKYKSLGTIQVLVKQTRQGKQITPNPGSIGLDAKAVPEKALKGQALSCRVRLGQPEAALSPLVYEATSVPGIPDPFATFVFKYRSHEGLKAERIIPRTPTPPPLEDRDLTTLNAEELKELQRRARAFRDERESKVKIKREAVDDGPRRRRVSRPVAGSTPTEFGEDGRVREGSTPTVTGEVEVIELD